MKLCIKGCGRPATRPVRQHPSRSYCQLCWQAMPCNQRAQSSRFNASRRERGRLRGLRRIYMGRREVAVGKTLEHTQAMRAQIRRLVHAFVMAQKEAAKRRGYQ